MAVPETTKANTPKSNKSLLVFSGDSKSSVQESATKFQEHIKSQPESLPDIAYTLSQTQQHGAHRAFTVTDGTGPLGLSSIVERTSQPVLNFVFTGLGAQWPRMAADLFENFESFRKDVRVMDKALQTLPHPPLWTIEDEILRPSSTSRVHKAEFSTPICCALQLGIVNILRSWGVKPNAVVGHSSGEIAAAYAVDAISMSEAIIVAFYYGQAAEGMPQGAMAAVGLRAEKTKVYLDGFENVGVACFNSASNTTISGAENEVDAVIERIKKDKPDVVARKLRVDRGYHHGPRASQVSAQFERVLSDELGKPSPKLSASFYSTVGKREKVTAGSDLGPSHWTANLEEPVQFSNAVANMLEDTQGRNVFLEIGPHSALEKPVNEIIGDSKRADEAVHVPTLTRSVDGTECLLKSLGRLFQEHVDVSVEGTTSGSRVIEGLIT